MDKEIWTALPRGWESEDASHQAHQQKDISNFYTLSIDLLYIWIIIVDLQEKLKRIHEPSRTKALKEIKVVEISSLFLDCGSYKFLLRVLLIRQCQDLARNYSVPANECPLC